MYNNSFKLSDDDDGFSFDAENTRTNLSSIFGVTSLDSTLNTSPNTSSKYVSSKFESATDSKQPQQQEQRQEQSSKKPSEWSIIIAKVVSAFKLINQENISQGKLGLTILKNPDDLRKIILYRSKTNILSTISFNDDTRFYVKNSYLQFRDDLQEFWSVLFEQQSDLMAVTELIKDKIFEEQKEEIKEKSSPYNIRTEFAKARKHNEEDSVSDSIYSPTSQPNVKSSSKAADLVSRMAKMGGQPLPKLTTESITTSTTTDQSDSSDTELITNNNNKPLVPLRKPKSSPQLVTFSHSQQQISPLLNTINTVAQYTTSSSLLTSQPSSNYDINLVNMMMTENRTQNIEVRMNISKLETKIEKVLDKIDLIQRHGINQNDSKDNQHKEDLILELEEKILDYKKENRKLRLQIDEYDEKIKIIQQQESNKPSTIVANDFSEFKLLIESLNINFEDFQQDNEIFKEIIRKLDAKNLLLKSLLNEEEAKIQKYKEEIEKLKLTNEKQNKYEEENQLLQNKVKELEFTINNLEKINQELKNENNDLKKKFENSTFDIENLKKDKINLQNQLEQQKIESEKIIENIIKEIMNNLYQKLVNRFEMKKTFSSEEILRVCATSIKQETNNVIKKTK